MKNLTFWTDETSVLLTSFWGWGPEAWGTVSFTQKGRRDKLLKTLTDPFITIIYVTSNQSHIDPKLKNMVAGFYLVSHEIGDRDEFTHPYHHDRSQKRWRFGLHALRAFSYLPEGRISIDEFDPSIKKNKRFRAVAKHGVLIRDIAQIDRLRNLLFEEVDVYQPTWRQVSPHDNPNEDAIEKGYVQGGPDRRSGYVVPDEDEDLPRSLYVLRLEGNTDAFLGKPAKGLSIYKIGLSVSPELRRQSFQKALPRGAFKWNLHKCTIGDSHNPYQSFAAAKFGEFQMKVFLAKHAEWLGSEFYAASEDVIMEAWRIGRIAALSKIIGN